MAQIDPNTPRLDEDKKIHSAGVVPYSSVVGSSVMLLNAAGACVGQLGIVGVGDQAAQEAVAQRVADAINAEANPKPDFPWREKDIRRGLILFRTSNNAHGFTNYSMLSSKVDSLPQRAKDELAAIMVNMALGFSESEVFRNGVVAARVAGEATQGEAGE